jgi:hypothetical protein
MDVARRADKLAKTDPKAAERLIEEAAETIGRDRQAHRETLRRTLPNDRQAAQELLAAVRRDLEGNELAAKDLQVHYRDDPHLPDMLAGIEQENQKYHQDIDLVARHWPDIVAP